jgi:hypothetical protein
LFLNTIGAPIAPYYVIFDKKVEKAMKLSARQKQGLPVAIKEQNLWTTSTTRTLTMGSSLSSFNNERSENGRYQFAGRLSGHVEGVYALNFSADGKFLASGGWS